MKLDETRKQFYHFSMRSCATTNFDACEDKLYAYIKPPENALTIENIFVHFTMTFDGSVASGDQIIRQIGIASEVPAAVEEDPRYLRTLEINEAAVGGVIDVKINLTPLLKKDNVTLDNNWIGDFLQNDMTIVYIKFDDDLRGNSYTGNIDLWKIDALFTTKGIR
jgi:hypothetical protein